jgi:hypothetical protein
MGARECLPGDPLMPLPDDMDKCGMPLGSLY